MPPTGKLQSSFFVCLFCSLILKYTVNADLCARQIQYRSPHKFMYVAKYYHIHEDSEEGQLTKQNSQRHIKEILGPRSLCKVGILGVLGP